MRARLPILALAVLSGCGPDLDPTSLPTGLDGGVGRPDAGTVRPTSLDGGVSRPDAGTVQLPVAVAGRYATHYQLEVSAFAPVAGDLATLLTVLEAVFSGQGAACTGQGTLEAQLLCIVVDLALARVTPPAWLGRLVTVLRELFRSGATPVHASGVLTLAEQDSRLAATETWTDLWLALDGQRHELLRGPAGALTLAVPDFQGTRTPAEVTLGPRRVELDVDRLVVNLLDAAIAAGSDGQAHDVGGLLELALCRPLLATRHDLYLGCLLASGLLASRFELRSSLGQVSIRAQRAALVEGAGHAASLGTVARPGTVEGAPGTAPFGSWYGIRQ